LALADRPGARGQRAPPLLLAFAYQGKKKRKKKKDIIVFRFIIIEYILLA
jgi:hypothetical protein